MKRMPPTLIAFLAANRNCHRADCFVIALPTGATLYATSGQWDITFLPSTPGWNGPQTTFYATRYGVWARESITSDASTDCNSNTMALTCVPRQDTLYPGLNIGILNAALNHLFDAATVRVLTAYMPMDGYGNVSVGVEVKFAGTITKTPNLSRVMVSFECADPLYLLNMKVPSRLMQSNCGYSFCDPNCSLDAANYTVAVAALAGTTQTVIVAGLTQPAGYFAQGVVKCLTGANAGLSQTVKASSASLTLMSSWVLPVAVGDTFSAIKGCDKTPTTCAATIHIDGTLEPQDYKLRFGGTPFVPVATSAV
jgi:hypothetical protein